MIQVKVTRNRNGHIDAFTISGHAGAGPAGFDLVCAGVSSVSFGAVNAVEALCGFSLLIDQNSNGGYLSGRLPDGLEAGKRKKAELLLEGMIIALRTIEMSYGKYIKVNDEGGVFHVET